VTLQTKHEWRIANIKTFELCAVAAALVLSFTTLSVAQAPMGTPAPAMSGKGEMKGEMGGGKKGEMKEADGMKKDVQRQPRRRESADHG
jgi:Spy/CpxP family protein refolding chaperone